MQGRTHSVHIIGIGQTREVLEKVFEGEFRVHQRYLAIQRIPLVTWLSSFSSLTPRGIYEEDHLLSTVFHTKNSLFVQILLLAGGGLKKQA